MGRVPTVQSLIKTHLLSGNLKYLEPALELGFEKLPRTRHYIRLLKKGFLYTANTHLNSGDLFRSLSAFEYARNLTPYDTRLLKKEFKLLERIFDKLYPDFVKRDAQIFIGSLQILEYLYGGRFPNLIKPLSSLIDRIGKLLDTLTDAKEGKFSHRINKIFCNQFEDLDQEQRDELISDILSEFVIEHLEELLESQVSPEEKGEKK